MGGRIKFFAWICARFSVKHAKVYILLVMLSFIQLMYYDLLGLDLFDLCVITEETVRPSFCMYEIMSMYVYWDLRI